jgi:hypothetical protein
MALESYILDIDFAATLLIMGWLPNPLGTFIYFAAVLLELRA